MSVSGATIGSQIQTVMRAAAIRVSGRVTAVRGLTVLVHDLPLPMGSMVGIDASAAYDTGVALGQVVGFSTGSTVVMMLGSTAGVRPGDRAMGLQTAQTAPVGDGLLGRCVDGLGRPIDGLGPVLDVMAREVDPPPMTPLARGRITSPLHTGVRELVLMTTLGRGQRLGIFAGPGVGKSTLLSTIARNAACDVAVLALIGERGREVRDFIEHALGPEGLRRSVVIASTSDESPLLRIRAALTACATAEHFRDQGKHVLLLIDSVTRFAHAHRQIGLSVGEPPASKGYTPSVFSAMARLLERAGVVGDGAEAGSITGLYTILVEGDDMTEPIADAARGILDGHVVLSRALAQRSHFPAIDVLDSVSRVADAVCDTAHVAARRHAARLLSAYREVEDLVQIGAYARGSSPETDVAIAYQGKINELLRQGPQDRESFESARSRLVKLALESGNAIGRGAARAGT
ncbi:MAG: FliI/YscN family ATPase [Phycisphaerales bacterium]